MDIINDFDRELFEYKTANAKLNLNGLNDEALKEETTKMKSLASFEDQVQTVSK